MKQFDRNSLSRQDQISYDILTDFYETGLSFRRFDWVSSESLYPVSPMWGTQVALPTFLLSGPVIKNEKTARNYVKRLQAAGGKLDAVALEVERQAGLGVVEPISLLDQSLIGIADTVKPAPADNPLVSTFAAHMDKVAALDASLKAQLKEQATAAVRDGIYPAYARMTAAHVALKPRAATQSAGVGRLPDGAAYYAQMLRLMTTPDYTPAQMHALGLREVARIDAEMDGLLKGQGLDTGPVAKRM